MQSELGACGTWYLSYVQGLCWRCGCWELWPLSVPVVLATGESMKEDVRLEQSWMRRKISGGLKELNFFLGAKGASRGCMFPRFLSADTENLLTLTRQAEEGGIPESVCRLLLDKKRESERIRGDLPISPLEVSDVVQKLCSGKVPHGRRMRFVLISWLYGYRLI